MEITTSSDRHPATERRHRAGQGSDPGLPADPDPPGDPVITWARMRAIWRRWWTVFIPSTTSLRARRSGCPVASVEQSLWDLLGSRKKTAGELMGGMLRKEIPVYLSGSGRETTAEQEVDVYVRGVEETGAKAVKFKIGGRMSRNADAYPGEPKRC